MQAARNPESVKQQRKFDQREAIRRKHVERIPQQLVGAGSEMVETPSASGSPRTSAMRTKSGASSLKRIEANRDPRISRLNEDQPLVSDGGALAVREHGSTRRRNGVPSPCRSK